jgi:hypothetical protein
VKEISSEAKDVTVNEWSLLSTALATTRFADVVVKLKASNNRPTEAYLLLPTGYINAGHESVNAILKKRAPAFRLTRIGPWDHREERAARLLAFARW